MGVGNCASALLEMSRKHSRTAAEIPRTVATPDTANDSPLCLELLTTTPLPPRVYDVSHGGLGGDIEEISETNFLCQLLRIYFWCGF